MVRVLKVRTLPLYLKTTTRVLWLISMVKMFLSPKSAYDDLYQVWVYPYNNKVYYDKEDDILYIIAHNGSGANAYEVCWQIVKGEYKNPYYRRTF